MPEIWKSPHVHRKLNYSMWFNHIENLHVERKLSAIFGFCLFNSEFRVKKKTHAAQRKITSLCVRAQNVNKMFAFRVFFFSSSFPGVLLFSRWCIDFWRILLTAKIKAIYSNQIELSANWLFWRKKKHTQHFTSTSASGSLSEHSFHKHISIRFLLLFH